MFTKIKNFFNKEKNKEQEKGTYIKYEVNKDEDIIIDISFQNNSESISNFCSLLSAVNTLYLHEDTMNAIKNSVVPSLGEEVFNQMLYMTTERSKSILSSDEDDYIKPSEMIDGE
jgi:hypothetical protein